VVRSTASLQGFLRLQTALALSPALPAGEPRVRSSGSIDSASLELGCPRIAFDCWSCKGLFMGTWRWKNAEPLLPAAVTLGSPSDNTTPRCQWVARCWVFVFTKPSTCCIGCCWEGRAGRGAEAASRPTAFFGRREIFRKLENQAVFGASYSLALGSTKPADSTEPIVPASPNRPAVPDARYLLHLTFTGYNAFIVGVENLL